jgi:hypothetical protein
MKKLLYTAICTTTLSLTLGVNLASAHNAFNGYKGYYGNDAGATGSTTGTPARNAKHTGAGHARTGYQYIEGSTYTSPYENNTGEYSGRNPDSRCYSGNYGYNGQTSNYDHSVCEVVYDAQTYVRLLRGSSAMGGTQYFGQ